MSIIAYFETSPLRVVLGLPICFLNHNISLEDELRCMTRY